MKHYFSIIALLLLAFQVSAQSAFVTVGGEATGEGGSMSFSVGEVTYKSTVDNQYTISEGVQQAYTIKDITPDAIKNLVKIELSAYPNPTSDVLHLVVKDADIDGLSYSVSDVKGRTQEKGTIVGTESVIQFSQYLDGVYFVEVKQKGKMVKRFEVLKN